MRAMFKEWRERFAQRAFAWRVSARHTWERVRRRFCHERGVAAGSLSALALCGCLGFMVSTVDMVTVTDTYGASRTVLAGPVASTNDIITLAGMETESHDQIEYSAGGVGLSNLVILRSFPVTLRADGRVAYLQTVPGTVADLLARQGVELGEEDFVEPGLQEELTEDTAVVVHRVTYREVETREVVEDEAVAAYEERLLAETPDAAFQRSNRGMYDVHKIARLVDGREESAEILSLSPVMQPREPGSVTFTPGVPCSRIEGYDDIQMGPDGLPTQYARLWQGAVCTAYSSSGGRGSSGLGLYNGTVAVNPNVIPYGTRLFITSADGSFVYGFAIATDTGTAMMEGRVDIDLYFETNGECLRFGKRALNVYILD